MILASHQPYFFPYLGYFSLISAVDKFVFFDISQFNRKSWMTRNRILKPNLNEFQYITVGTQHTPSGSYLSLIFESLTAINYKGKVNIIINEAVKRAIAPFETNIPFTEFYYTELKLPPGKGYIFSSNKPSTKKFLFEFYQNLWEINRNDFLQLIHPSSVISSTVVKGLGLQIEPLSVIAPYTKIGFGVNVGRNCSVGHHNVLNDFCSIYLGTNIGGHTEIGEGSVIGPGCTIFSQIKIGANTTIGGGSVVTKDIPSNVLAFGNPCIVVKNLT